MPEKKDRARINAEAHALYAAAFAKETGFDFGKRAQALARALSLFRDLGDETSQALVLTKLGNIASNAGDFDGALEYFHEAEDITDRLGDYALSRELRLQLAGTLIDLGEFESALDLAEKGRGLDADAKDAEIQLIALNSLGCVLVAMGRHEEGVARLRESLTFLVGIKKQSRRAHMHAQSMADLSDALLKWGKPAEAFEHAQDGAEVAKRIEHPPLIMLNALCAGRAALALGRAEQSATCLESAVELASRMGLRLQESHARFELANALELLQRYDEALSSYRKGHSVEREIRRDEAARRLQLRRTKKAIEGAQHERESADRVLFAVLPKSIATRIKNGETCIADEVLDVSVLFADLVGFTAMSTRTAPRDLLGVLDRIFSEFDKLTATYGVEKVKTIGDAYMTVGGLFATSSDHLERSARLGLEMNAAVKRMGVEMGFDLAVRIGLHVGPAIAGVIGTQRLSYDLWGETVNLASRLESSGVSGRIHVSTIVADRLKGILAAEPRGPVVLKGFGTLPTFLIA